MIARTDVRLKLLVLVDPSELAALVRAFEKPRRLTHEKAEQLIRQLQERADLLARLRCLEKRRRRRPRPGTKAWRRWQHKLECQQAFARPPRCQGRGRRPTKWGPRPPKRPA